MRGVFTSVSAFHDFFAVDAFDLLDHRTRERLIAEAHAPAGRYLAVERGGETLLIARTRPITHIGRGLIADVRLEDPHVSRRNAILAVRGNGADAARILDNRSSNGTFVNGRRITVSSLSRRDVLRFGRATLRYVEVAPHRQREPIRRIPLARLRQRHVPLGTAA
jgi:hypothetical protein